jgi:hypothetical protein
MALPEQSIAMGYLERETASTLVDSKRFVMFDENKSKSASLEDIKDHILGDMVGTIEQQNSLIQTINSQLGTFADELEVDDEGLVWLLNQGERIAGPYGPFAGGGGGGGGGGSSNNAILSLMNTSGWLSTTIAEGANCPITFAWSSTEDDIPTGNGILVVRVNGSIRVNRSIAQGEISIDISEYLTSGTNSVRITVSDVYSNNKSINYTISMITLSIKSNFDSSIPQTGSFTFSYTPIGSIQKTVYFLLDGVEVGREETSYSNRQLSYTIPARSHGAHSLLVYFESEVNGNIIRSNELYYDIIYVESGVLTPIVASSFRETTTEQYTVLKIPYTIYNPSNLISEAKLYVNDSLYSTQYVNRDEQIWSYRADTVGSLTLKIQSGLIYKEFNLIVTESAVIAEVTTQDMVLGLQSVGRSNAEENPGTWIYESTDKPTIRCQFSNFNYVSNGWVLDDDGNTVLRINGNARLTIPYKPFAEDFTSTGKTIEIDFATRDVLNYDAVIMSCMSGDRGFSLTTQKATLKSEQSEVNTQYKEDEHVRISFVVEKRSERYPLFYIYINGIMSGVVQYPANDNFSQTTPVNITVGTNDCTTDIYCIRIYDNNLNRNQILDNWIADTQNVALMLQRYEHNNVYDEYGSIVVEKLPNDLPYMILSGPELPQKKKDAKNCDGTFVDPSNPSKSFSFTGASVDVQGTSSQFYARKNYKIKFSGGFDMTQSGEHVTKYDINNGIPTKTFTFKADVASSEGANNVELVRLYNNACPYKTPPQLTNDKIRQGIDGFPIVMFWDNGETVSFLGKYNWNNDKGTEEVFGFVEGDESWETLNNSGGYALWKNADFTTTYIDDDGNTQYYWLSDFEARYPDTKPVYTDSTQLAALASWLVTTNQETATGATLSQPYTDDKGVVHTVDNAAYRLAKFHTEAGDHFEMESVLFMYLFTELFLLVDSRAKNAFPSFLSGDKWCFLPYDMDTALGIDNRGALTFGYSLEDIDYIGTMPVFNGQDSVLWINVRDAFGDELQQMYQEIRSQGLISYQNVERMFEEHQAKWPEAIFNEDAWFKYIDPLLNDGNGDYLSMALGSKAEQRKWWLYNRFRYIDSKYTAGETMSDTISIRPGAIPANVNEKGITITPYADIYAAVRWDNDTIKRRATHGVPIMIPCPYEQVGDNVIEILNASQLASVGDLSGFKPHRASFANASRLQSVKLGSNATGYTNPNLKDVTFGNNFLLKTVDVRNCTELTGNINLAGATNIENIYCEGTAITSVTLPNGGILQTLHLPSTVTSIIIRNHANITDLSIPTYENVKTIVLENVPTIDTKALLLSNELASDGSVRINFSGFTWNVANKAEIDTIFDKLDTLRGAVIHGDNIDTTPVAQVQGTIHIDYLTGAEIAAYGERYPYITIDADRRDCNVYYCNADGIVYYTEEVHNGMHAVYSGQPSKGSTNQYIYTFAGWSETNNNIPDANAQLFILKDRTLYPCYTVTIKSYRVDFIRSSEDGGGVLYTQENVLYGEIPEYRGATPTTIKGSATDWPFYGWSPVLGPTTGNMTYVAIFKDTSPITRVLIARRPLEASGSMSYIGSYAFGYCGQLNTISFPNVNLVSDSAFYGCQSLVTINLPNLTTIGSYAFAECGALSSITLPLVTSMEREAFRHCEQLTTINFPLLTTVPSWTFTYCYNLSSINLPEVSLVEEFGFGYCGMSSIYLSNAETIKQYAFYGCNSLRTIDFPEVTTINYAAFATCEKLSNLKLPKVTFIDTECFASCRVLMSISLPALQVLSQSAFASCPNLVNVRLSAVTSIGSSAFAYCYYLRSLYLLGPSVPRLPNTNAFENTPLSNTHQGVPGSIYVPASMVANYQATPEWSPYSSRITAYIE